MAFCLKFWLDSFMNVRNTSRSVKYAWAFVSHTFSSVLQAMALISLFDQRSLEWHSYDYLCVQGCHWYLLLELFTAVKAILAQPVQTNAVPLRFMWVLLNYVVQNPVKAWGGWDPVLGCWEIRDFPTYRPPSFLPSMLDNVWYHGMPVDLHLFLSPNLYPTVSSSSFICTC